MRIAAVALALFLAFHPGSGHRTTRYCLASVVRCPSTWAPVVRP